MHVRFALLALLIATPDAEQSEALRFPQPPQQSAPWVATETVPTNLLSAASTLFAQGFPDPRGCEYRHVTVEVGSVWGEPRYPAGTNPATPPVLRASTRGWVLPETPGEAQRFAICWNGLIYPLVELGSPASLAEEAATLPRWVDSRYIGGSFEMRSVFSTNAGSLRILLLLRSGFAEAAVKDWQTFNQSQSIYGGLPRSALTNNDDPYLTFARDWTWSLFDRAVCAHMRGADALALNDAQILDAVKPRIETETVRRGFPRERYGDWQRRDQTRPYLDSLETLPQLLNDLQRRAREGQRVPALTRGLTNWPASAERIAVLIRDLDLVAARQSGQPGGVALTSDPVVSALVAEGDPAVAALIDCLATDQRLTRSVSFGRDFHRGRTLIPVSSAAHAALRAILQTDLPTAAAWRAYWRRFGGMRIEERWFTLLQDDQAGMSNWLEVSKCITRPVDVPASLYPYARSLLLPPTNPPPLIGEWLRAKVHPTLSEVLARRALEVVPTNASGYDFSLACQIGLTLARWDLSAAGPVATKLIQRHAVVNEYSQPPAQNWERQRLGILLAELACVRARAGEPAPFSEYADWLPTTTPESFGSNLEQGLAPLIEFPTNPMLQVAAERLFSADSSWARLPWKGVGLVNPVDTGLVKVAAFRKLLARELEVKTVCGSLSWRGPETITFHLTNAPSLSGSRSIKLSDAERPAEGTGIELRWCDWLAWGLANAKQIPAFNPFAPQKQRDEAIQRAQIRLRESPAP